MPELKVFIESEGLVGYGTFGTPGISDCFVVFLIDSSKKTAGMHFPGYVKQDPYRELFYRVIGKALEYLGDVKTVVYIGRIPYHFYEHLKTISTREPVQGFYKGTALKFDPSKMRIEDWSMEELIASTTDYDERKERFKSSPKDSFFIVHDGYTEVVSLRGLEPSLFPSSYLRETQTFPLLARSVA